MSVLIKDMEIPETCDDCPFHVYHRHHEYVCKATPMFYPMNLANSKGIRKDWCPLSEVPESCEDKPKEIADALSGENWLINITADIEKVEHQGLLKKAVIDAVKNTAVVVAWDDEADEYDVADIAIKATKHSVIESIEELPFAQPERQHGRIFQEIVVEYPLYSTYTEYEGKPYFSIKYTENGQEFIGYGTYKPEVLSEYLKEYFMPSAQPEIIRCKDCKYWCINKRLDIPWCRNLHIDRGTDDFCSNAERREEGDG